MLSINPERPIALIVEDQPETLATRRELFDTYGFQAIGARNISDALREFRATPTIDMLVTDINLDPENEEDRSGIELARNVRERRPLLPIVAYSGHFDALDNSERSNFNDSLLKADLTVASFKTKLVVWRGKALEYRKLRADKARTELARMRADGSAVEPDVEVLHDFLPGSHALAFDLKMDFETPDEVLRREGWRFRLVEAGFPLENGLIKTGVAVPFWIRREETATIAVLQGHPCIYNDGTEEDSAVSGALELMLGYFNEFTRSPSAALADELDELRKYLDKIFR
ncbi:MAG: response regulator [Bryobacteraceae bacterium]